MQNFRFRPKDNYLNEASWDELLFLTKKWKSELTLYAYDLKYLEQELDNSFAKLLIYQDPIELHEIKNDFEIYLVQCLNLFKSASALINKLTLLIEDPCIYSAPNTRKELELFEEDYSEHIETIKAFRLIILLMLKNLSQKTSANYYWKMN